MRVAWFLLPLFVKGAAHHQIVLQSHHELITGDQQWTPTSQSISPTPNGPITIQARPTTVYRPRSLDALHRARQRSFRYAQSEAVEWDAVQVLGPDVESRHTLVQLARMAGDAYSFPGGKKWYDVDEAWNTVSMFLVRCSWFLILKDFVRPFPLAGKLMKTGFVDVYSSRRTIRLLSCPSREPLF